jgi:hypothetical protein
VSFHSNAARLAHLKHLLARGDQASFEKQAWEWLRTSVFGLNEFHEVLRMAPPTRNITVQQVDCPQCGYQEGLP